MAVSSRPRPAPTAAATLELSRAEARRLLLAAQGLSERRTAPAAKADALATIRRMGALQIDTISVVNRSPYFVLWSRLGAYEPAWLDELLAEGALFETWGRAASFVPVEDWPLFRGRMLERHGKWTRQTLTTYADLVAAVLARIRAEGALAASDFEAKERHPGRWWNWREEKQVLEALFHAEQLMIARRRNFQRLYDLPERVRPGEQDEPPLPREAADRALVLNAVRALGVATAAWTRDCYHTSAAFTAACLEALAREGELLRARVEGIAEKAYVHPDNLALLDAAAPDAVRAVLLSPFDPVVCDRRRALQLFDFDYRIECYTPAAQRRYGYFSLPLLAGDGLVGRLDAKAHRKEGVFEVKSLHLEPGGSASDELVAALAATLRDCAGWHGTPRIRVTRSEPAPVAAALEQAVGN